MTPLASVMVMLNTLAIAGTGLVLYSLYVQARPQPYPLDNSYPPQQYGPAMPNRTQHQRPPQAEPQVQYFLFNKRTGISNPYVMRLGNHSNFMSSPFNMMHPTKFVIHGFLSNANTDFVQIIRDSYLKSGDYNVITVDWSGASSFDYVGAMNGAHATAYSVAAFTKWLMKEGVKASDIHYVGHSLGAHVSGMAGHRVNDPQIARITGLDPAGPGYYDMPLEYRLDPTDAKLVDVVHTYMKVLALDEPLGNVDFYPNGGRTQPGCPDPNESIWNLGGSVLCNHGRAFWLFAESIMNKKAFKATKCANVEEALRGRCNMQTDVHMGQADTYEPGLYYFKTKSVSPFTDETK